MLLYKANVMPHCSIPNITICNYNTYQDINNYKCDSVVTQVGNSCDTSVTGVLLNKNGKKGKNVKKDIYGEFKNVKLSTDECRKLVEKFGKVGTKERVEALSEGIESKGYKYSSHYATILTWERKDKKDNPESTTGGGYDTPQREIR